MADDKRDAPDAKRRRPATIDLKATEIASEPVKPAEPVEKAAETPRPAPAPEAAAGASSPPEPPRAPGASSWRPEWLDAAALNERFARLRDRLDWRVAGAGLAGAAVMFLLFLALWGGGAFTPRDEVTPLTTRIAGLEKQLRDLSARPQPTPVADPRIAELATRVAATEQGLTKVEQAAAAPRAAPADQALTARVAALETAVRPLAEIGSRLDGASTAARDAKSRADAAFEAAQKNVAAPAAQAADHKEIEALGARVAALEQALKSSEARIATTAGADKAGRLAFVAVALRATVERGDPFVQELAAVRPLVADAKALGALEPLAASGVPRASALARELSSLTTPMLAAAGGPPRDGFIDRLQANAERLVRIRPIDEAPGDDPAAIVGRADVKATKGDLAGAAAELGKLPEAARAPAQDWIKRVQAREAALAAARKLADDAVGALAKAGQ
ncbi:MAG TPA: hypothetical protein VJT13_04685 [Xanthobacteraceae bacterium]|nr:hypothetical protein [Xanthobacteraceae bacterium]